MRFFEILQSVPKWGESVYVYDAATEELLGKLDGSSDVKSVAIFEKDSDDEREHREDDGPRAGRGGRGTRSGGRGGCRADGRESVRGGAERPPQGEQPVADEKSRSHPPDHADETRESIQERSDARHPHGDEHRIRQRADRRDQEHVLTLQALAQHEQVLRADGDDERQPEGDPSEEGVDHDSTLCSA